MRLLHTVMCVLKSGDRAADKADKVDDFIRRHHKKFLRCYRRCRKPKGHFARHIAPDMKRAGKNVACWSGERHHRGPKQMAAYVYKSLSTTLVRKCLVRMVHNAGRPEVYCCEHLDPLKNPHSLYTELLRAHGLQLSARGRVARTRAGTFRAGDFVLWRGGSAQPWGAGVLKEAVLALQAGGDESMYAVVDTYALVDDRSSPATWVYERAARFDVVSMSRLMWLPAFFTVKLSECTSPCRSMRKRCCRKVAAGFVKLKTLECSHFPSSTI